MMEKQESGFSSFGHDYEDVSDKTVSIKNMLRTLTSKQHEEKYKNDSMPPVDDHEDSDISSVGDKTECSVQGSEPSHAFSEPLDMEEVPMETVEDTTMQTTSKASVKELPVKKPPAKVPPKVAKKKLILNADLKAAHRIVMQIMSDRANYAFMDEVDVVALNLWDYHDRIKEPMWLTKIEQKFENEEYSTITEVIRDLRLMLENCYRYNGLEHYVSKQAMKIEQVMETKLSLLPRILQVQTTLYVTSNGKFGEPPVTASTSLTGRRRTSGRFNSGGATTPLSNCIQTEFINIQLEAKKRQQQERHEELLRYRQELDEWEKDLLRPPNQEHLNAMWEIPAIGQFLLLFQEALALNEGSYYELERCFLLPRESKLLAQIFTCLLSSPTQRKREISKNMGMAMPYSVWQRKLKERIQKWYQVVDSWQDTQWAASDLGIDVHFFEVMGDKFPLNDYQYHELTYYQRVVIMKAVCDNCLEMQPTLKQCLEVQPNLDQRAIVLGEDASGNTYVHFPQFCGYDLRVYKQAPFPEPELRYIEVDVPDEPENMEIENNGNNSESPCKKTDVEEAASPEQRKRPSYLRQRLTPVINNLSHSQKKHSKHSRSSKELFNTSNQKKQDESNNCNNTSKDNDVENTEDSHANNGMCTRKENNAEDRSVEKLTENNCSNLTNDVIKDESNLNNSNSVFMCDCLSDNHICNQKPNIGKLMPDNYQEMNGQLAIQSVIYEPNTKMKDLKTSEKDASICNKEINHDTKIIDEKEQIDRKIDKDENEHNLPHEEKCDEQYNKEKIMNDLKTKIHKNEKAAEGGKELQKTEISANEHSNLDSYEENVKCKNEELDIGNSEAEVENCSSEGVIKNSETVEEPVKPKFKLPEVEPDKESFALVCDSIESLKLLVAKFAEREPVEVTKGRKKKIVNPPPRSQCEVELHERLTCLLGELLPHESKLTNAVGRVKERLRKDFDNFQDSQEENDSWESESSSSSSGSSSSDSDSNDSSDDENEQNENYKQHKKEEQITSPVEIDSIEIDEPFQGISTRAQKISKQKKLIAAKRKAKLRGNEEQPHVKKQCLGSVITPVSESIITTQNSILAANSKTKTGLHLSSVSMKTIYQTLQNQVAAACRGNHSIVSSTNIPGKSETNPIGTATNSQPWTIVVDDSVWKEIQNDPRRQKEVILKHLLEQKQRLSSQSNQTLRTTQPSQEIPYAANVDVTTPIPKLNILQKVRLPISEAGFAEQTPLSSQFIESKEKLMQQQYSQTILKEPQRKVERAKKDTLSHLASNNCHSNTTTTTTDAVNIPTVSVVDNTGNDKMSLTEQQTKDNQLHQAKKQKENMLAQQWLQQLLSFQQSPSKSPSKSQITGANVIPVSQVPTLTNIKTPTGVNKNVQIIPNSQLIAQAAKLLTKPNNNKSTVYLQTVKKVLQHPNAFNKTLLSPNVLATSVPSSGVKKLADNNIVKIQNHTISTSDKNTVKGNQDVVVSLEYLQKLQQQAAMQTNSRTEDNQQAKTVPQNTINKNLIVLKASDTHSTVKNNTNTVSSHGNTNQNAEAITSNQSSIPQHSTIKLQPNVSNTQTLPPLIKKQGQLCIVKLADGTLRTLNVVNQKAPIKKKILASSLLTNQGNSVYLNVPAQVTNPQQINSGTNIKPALVIQNPLQVTDQSSPVVKATSSLVLTSPNSALKQTPQQSTMQNAQPKPTTLSTKIVLDTEEYKSYVQSGILPSRYIQQTASKVPPLVDTAENGLVTSLQSNHKEVNISSTNSCANTVCDDI